MGTETEEVPGKGTEPSIERANKDRAVTALLYQSATGLAPETCPSRILRAAYAT